ncbi:MAG: phosphoenolpyruvate synthase, partial [Smithella sp.]
MSSYVLGFEEIDKTKLAIVGGKGANLGELSRIEGINVPEGFCVTTEAYKRIIEDNKELNELLNQLSLLKADDREKISDISGKIRTIIEGISIPKEIDEQVTRFLTLLGKDNAYAVRSSATAEDLPTASFAGQQDTYLNIIGKDTILHNISKCWASLFTDRAVTYRMQNGFDHRKVQLSVVIQKMVFPQAAGIMFTADPVTSNRKVLSIDAGFGLGEALVSGLVNPDIYRVREGRIIEKKISTKKLAIYGLREGGTEEIEIEAHKQNMQTLTDEQILELEGIGRKIERYFSCPQDIEWCLYEGASKGDIPAEKVCSLTLFIVQSRPITTLYPLPTVSDGKNHVYISFGHMQMMTETIKPLGISFLQILNKNYILSDAGGRLFYDMSYDVGSSMGRKIVLNSFGQADPLIKNAMSNLFKRKQFLKTLPHGKRTLRMGTEGMSWDMPIHVIKMYRRNDPADIKELIRNAQKSVRDLQQRITGVSGEELFDFILQDRKQLMEVLANARGVAAGLIGMVTAARINKKLEKWLGEKGAVDVLSQSVDNNISSEMGLELLDVADVVRKYPEVIRYLEHSSEETFFEDLGRLEGGKAVSQSLQ